MKRKDIVVFGTASFMKGAVKTQAAFNKLLHDGGYRGDKDKAWEKYSEAKPAKSPEIVDTPLPGEEGNQKKGGK